MLADFVTIVRGLIDRAEWGLYTQKSFVTILRWKSDSEEARMVQWC
jgi:hypothetical protein